MSIDGTKRWDTFIGWASYESLNWVSIYAHTHMIDYGFSEDLYGDPEDYQQQDGYVFYRARCSLDDWPADKCITIEDLRAKRITPPTQDSPDMEIDVSVDSSSPISESNSHANGRNPPQRAACNQSDEPLTFPGVSDCDSANKDNAAQASAASCERATQRTRTADLSFTKAPLCQLS